MYLKKEAFITQANHVVGIVLGMTAKQVKDLMENVPDTAVISFIQIPNNYNDRTGSYVPTGEYQYTFQERENLKIVKEGN
jgi:hypothetical protein